MRDCLAEAPTVLLVDVSHLVVASSAAFGRIVGLVADARRWPDARIGLCGSTAEIGALLAEYEPGDRPEIYTDVEAGVLDALDLAVAQRTTIPVRPQANAPAHAR